MEWQNADLSFEVISFEKYSNQNENIEQILGEVYIRK